MLVLLCELSVLSHMHELWRSASRTSQFLPRALAFWLIASALMLLHEGAHAVACKRFGGQVQEMGLLIRYFMLCAYTRVDDILLFQRRHERVYVLLLGPLTGLCILPLALLVWHYAPPSSFGRVVAADLLVWYNLFGLMQFLPFMKFDGYYILAQLMRMPELRTDSYRYLTALGLSCLGRGERFRISPECARYVEPACIVYGILSVAATSVLMVVLLSGDIVSLRHLMGRPVFVAFISLLALFVFWRLSRAALARSEGATSREQPSPFRSVVWRKSQ